MAKNLILWLVIAVVLMSVFQSFNGGEQVDRQTSYTQFVKETFTLESVIDVGQGISVGPGKFDKKNKRRALNTHVLCSK